MSFAKVLEISVWFTKAYDILLQCNGQDLEKNAQPFMGMIEDKMRKEQCSPAEAVLMILKTWYDGAMTIPTSALTLWLLASAVIIEKKERSQRPLFAEQGK